MPDDRSITQYIHDNLSEAGWPGLELSEDEKTLKCPKGEIIVLKSGQYHLKFISYSRPKREFYEKEKYGELIWPKELDIKKALYFRGGTGNYKISREPQFKKVVNPFDKEVHTIKITNGNAVKRFYGKTLTISKDYFFNALDESEKIYKKKNSYAGSVENYLANLASANYQKNVKRKVTNTEPGEFTFLIDRFNLSTKKRKKDFDKYLDDTDKTSLEDFLDQLIKNEVLSEDFLRRLNDYFIKEKLTDIIEWGRKILALKSSNVKTQVAQNIVQELKFEEIGQLETLWQKFFEKYLLYLIFSYKKIFPKIQFTDIEGDKKYPDFIGVNHYNGLDVIEIKTHLKNILVWDGSHKNFYFSGEMSKAIVQTMNYLDAITQERFKNQQDKRKITSFVEEENLFHPRGIIIISSREKLTTKSGEDEKLTRDFTKLRNSLHNIEILTFDEILNISDEYIKNIIDSEI